MAVDLAARKIYIADQRIVKTDANQLLFKIITRKKVQRILLLLFYFKRMSFGSHHYFVEIQSGFGCKDEVSVF